MTKRTIFSSIQRVKLVVLRGAAYFSVVRIKDNKKENRLK